MIATIHATAVAIDGHGVLLVGRPGCGKSDLALRLIDRGAMLVADDRVDLHPTPAALRLHPPAAIAGLIEVRGVGLVRMPWRSDVAAALLVVLDEAAERMPQPEQRAVAGLSLPLLRLDAFQASAPIRVERALALVTAGR